MFNAFQNALKHRAASWGCCCSRIGPKAALSRVGSARCDYFVFMSSTKRVSVNNCSQGVRPLLASFFLTYLQHSPMLMLTYATRGMNGIRLCRAPQILVSPSSGEHHSFLHSPFSSWQDQRLQTGTGPPWAAPHKLLLCKHSMGR